MCIEILRTAIDSFMTEASEAQTMVGSLNVAYISRRVWQMYTAALFSCKNRDDDTTSPNSECTGGINA